MIDYSIFRKKSVAPDQLEQEGQWDLFLSGFTLATRVTDVFRNVRAAEKKWLVFPQYEFPLTTLPPDDRTYQSVHRDEDVYFDGLLNAKDLSSLRLCVDITGLLRPHLLFLLRYLSQVGVGTVDVLYSEPGYYKGKEHTPFAGEAVVEVRSVRGFEGSPDPAGKEVLIIGAGYDAHLISALCLSKEQAKKIVLVAFPSLKPEMYQESLLRISEASESLGIEPGDPGSTFFVPANDPFETAAVLRRIVRDERAAHGHNINIYLCPLATKAQALGFFLFYDCELRDTSASIHYPFTKTHSSDTTQGISRVWRYTIEFETLRAWREIREATETGEL